jgi:hypothetical protein
MTHIDAGTISGGQFSFGSGDNVINQGVLPPAPGATERVTRPTDGSPVSSLYAFGDIVGYSRFNARLQEESQARLVRVLDDSLAEAGVDPQTVEAAGSGRRAPAAIPRGHGHSEGPRDHAALPQRRPAGP